MSKKDHRKGRIWASKVLAEKDNVQEHKPRLPAVKPTKFGDKQREIFWDREISGEMKKGLVKCPACKQLFSAEIEEEYVSGRPWRSEDGKLMVVCGNCRNTRK